MKHRDPVLVHAEREARDLLGYVRFYSRFRGYPPTLREASEHLKLSRYRVGQLAWFALRRRWMSRRERSPRTIRVTPKGARFLRAARRRRI